MKTTPIESILKRMTLLQRIGAALLAALIGLIGLLQITQSSLIP